MKAGFFSLCGNTTQGKPCSGPVLALYGIAVLIPNLVKPLKYTHKITVSLPSILPSDTYSVQGRKKMFKDILFTHFKIL